MRGARLVLSARSEEELRELTEEIKANGGLAIAVRADVGDAEDVRRLAQAAQEQFGGFDIWVNNAGVSIYGKPGFCYPCTDRVSAGGSGISRGGHLARKTCRRPIVGNGRRFQFRKLSKGGIV